VVFHFSVSPILALGPTDSLIQWAPAAPLLEVERLGRESENALPCIVEIKNIWSCTSTFDMPTRPTQV